MNEVVKYRIIQLENIQSKLNSISSSIKNDDAINIEKAWNDSNSMEFINKLIEVSDGIHSLSSKIDASIEKIIKSSGGSNNE